MITTAIIEIIATAGLFVIILGELQLNKALIECNNAPIYIQKIGLFFVPKFIIMRLAV